jgi:hypothetical protein
MQENEKNEPQTEQTPTDHALPMPKRDGFFANPKRASRPQPKVPPPSSWNRKGSGRAQTPRRNPRGR